MTDQPFEIATHVHAEIPPWRHRRSTQLRRVVRLAGRLDKLVKIARDQHVLKPVVKYMSRRARHLGPGHNQIALPIPLASHRHRDTPPQPHRLTQNQRKPTSSTGCQALILKGNF